jgi:hypothetical protein
MKCYDFTLKYLLQDKDFVNLSEEDESCSVFSSEIQHRK